MGCPLRLPMAQCLPQLADASEDWCDDENMQSRRTFSIHAMHLLLVSLDVTLVTEQTLGGMSSFVHLEGMLNASGVHTTCPAPF